jgi:uncharacterized protein YeaO (DUF488 family)
VRIKRAYDPPAADDGLRVLVDRFWPRGVPKASARVDEWMRELAPSDELRRWYGHDPARFDEFRVSYRAELRERIDPLTRLVFAAERGRVTILCGARDVAHSNAAVLGELLEESLR